MTEQEQLTRPKAFVNDITSDNGIIDSVISIEESMLPPLEATDKSPFDASRGPEHCSPALTECPRCNNDWRICDVHKHQKSNQ